jgi:hypothetical protein
VVAAVVVAAGLVLQATMLATVNTPKVMVKIEPVVFI